MSSIPVPIIDSHIHLFPADELATLAWNSPAHPLWAQHSIAQYRAATASSHDLLAGFIFLETDRRTTPSSSSDDDATTWAHPLQEVAFVARIAAGRPLPSPADQGHAPADRALCLALVPWAPVAAGAAALQRYLAAVRAACARHGDASVWPRVRGVRYLLQDKPARAALAPAFVDALRLLGREGLAFDVGVDHHRRGRAQLEDAVAMVERAHDGVPDAEKVTFVLNHLCKPDLTTVNPADPSFIAWRTAMFTLSKADNVYMKLSGALSEMTPELANSSPDDIFDAISPWLAVVVALFGPERLMFGSDWPVCTVGVADGAWDKWRLVVERLCFASGFDEEQTALVFGGTARRAYKIPK